MRKWFEIVNKADKAEIWIYEQIGEDFWSGGGTTAKGFQKELASIKSGQIDLHINSPGGEVFDGLAIYNLLKQHPANITTYIDGLAASIASVIALAGSEVFMAENALFMVHNPWGHIAGDAKEMRQMADTLDKVRGSILQAYISKTGKTETELTDMMDAETWLTSDEAAEMGFVDEITGRMDMAACAKFLPVMQKANYKNIPRDLACENKAPENERDLENALRDAGYSRKEAKSIIAFGFKGLLRDAEPPEPPKVEEPLRDAEPPKPAKKDRIADLLVRAEVLAPSQT